MGVGSHSLPRSLAARRVRAARRDVASEWRAADGAPVNLDVHPRVCGRLVRREHAQPLVAIELGFGEA